ncbi:MAG: PHP domain-containing protein, partial [Gammaproteobacteria bacterium]|nr:PHP domain-containing protein [Gammaproteobacteria bacterium]
MIHLKLHSEYSIVDGIVRVSELMERLQQLNMSAVAVTDLSNLFAMVKFYRAAIKAGIKPIIGSEIIMLRGEQRSRVTLLCQNQQGYHNLTALISRGYTEGQTNDGVPLVHTEWMEEKTDGLIALSGGCQGDVGQALLSGKEGQAEQCLQQWLQWFPDRFYLELQRT